MLKTRIKKLENMVPMQKNLFDSLKNAELVAMTRQIQLYLYKKIKDKQLASEYKELFIDKPDILEFVDPATPTTKEAPIILKRQMNWELSRAKLEIEKDEISDYYENAIKAYKFFRNV